jgi:hypothetical protein
MPPNDSRNNGTADPGESADPLNEAEELRAQLQVALARTARLVAALKAQRRQGKVVQSALDALRRLQPGTIPDKRSPP